MSNEADRRKEGKNMHNERRIAALCLLILMLLVAMLICDRLALWKLEDMLRDVSAAIGDLNCI